MSSLDEKLTNIGVELHLRPSQIARMIDLVKKAFEEELPEPETEWHQDGYSQGIGYHRELDCGYNRCLSEIKQKLWGSK